ncbi:MAG TPA: hypothetical protein VMN39_09730 [Longimicrobiaceae bacterium]|nr:hypothetical protein [Longimicrobiaceae bacterium]
MLRQTTLLVLAAVTLGACSQYRLASLQDVEIPSYEPRVVLIPQTCEGLIQRAATQGMSNFTETEAREVLFCQQQQIIRTQEEEAAAKRLESHAAAARFVLQTVAWVVTGTVAVLTWVF